MVSVAYTHRIICDSSFIKWLLEQMDKNTLFSHLMYIKSSSEQWKKYHNLILSSEIKLNKRSLTILLFSGFIPFLFFMNIISLDSGFPHYLK